MNKVIINFVMYIGILHSISITHCIPHNDAKYSGKKLESGALNDQAETDDDLFFKSIKKNSLEELAEQNRQAIKNYNKQICSNLNSILKKGISTPEIFEKNKLFRMIMQWIEYNRSLGIDSDDEVKRLAATGVSTRYYSCDYSTLNAYWYFVPRSHFAKEGQEAPVDTFRCLGANLVECLHYYVLLNYKYNNKFCDEKGKIYDFVLDDLQLYVLSRFPRNSKNKDDDIAIANGIRSFIIIMKKLLTSSDNKVNAKIDINNYINEDDVKKYKDLLNENKLLSDKELETLHSLCGLNDIIKNVTNAYNDLVRKNLDRKKPLTYSGKIAALMKEEILSKLVDSNVVIANTNLGAGYCDEEQENQIFNLIEDYNKRKRGKTNATIKTKNKSAYEQLTSDIKRISNNRLLDNDIKKLVTDVENWESDYELNELAYALVSSDQCPYIYERLANLEEGIKLSYFDGLLLYEEKKIKKAFEEKISSISDKLQNLEDGMNLSFFKERCDTNELDVKNDSERAISSEHVKAEKHLNDSKKNEEAKKPLNQQEKNQQEKKELKTSLQSMIDVYLPKAKTYISSFCEAFKCSESQQAVIKKLKMKNYDSDVVNSILNDMFDSIEMVIRVLKPGIDNKNKKPSEKPGNKKNITETEKNLEKNKKNLEKIEQKFKAVFEDLNLLEENNNSNGKNALVKEKESESMTEREFGIYNLALALYNIKKDKIEKEQKKEINEVLKKYLENRIEKVVRDTVDESGKNLAKQIWQTLKEEVVDAVKQEELSTRKRNFFDEKLYEYMRYHWDKFDSKIRDALVEVFRTATRYMAKRWMEWDNRKDDLSNSPKFEYMRYCLRYKSKTDEDSSLSYNKYIGDLMYFDKEFENDKSQFSKFGRPSQWDIGVFNLMKIITTEYPGFIRHLRTTVKEALANYIKRDGIGLNEYQGKKFFLRYYNNDDDEYENVLAALFGKYKYDCDILLLSGIDPLDNYWEDEPFNERRSPRKDGIEKKIEIEKYLTDKVLDEMRFPREDEINAKIIENHEARKKDDRIPKYDPIADFDDPTKKQAWEPQKNIWEDKIYTNAFWKDQEIVFNEYGELDVNTNVPHFTVYMIGPDNLSEVKLWDIYPHSPSIENSQDVEIYKNYCYRNRIEIGTPVIKTSTFIKFAEAVKNKE